MKNSILTVLAITTLVACKKSETSAVSNSTDTTTVMAPVDNAIPADSTNMAGTTEMANSMSTQDKQFVDNAAKGGMMEVMLGKIAETNATNAKVKAFGKLMVEDHTKINAELMSWASTVSYSLPTALNADQQKKVDELKTKKGMEFDKAYTDFMVNDHLGDINEFKKEASDGGNSSVKSFASKTLPILEHHLVLAEEAMKTVK